jgi:hypothetical protein
MLTISTIPEALIELENQTGRVWTDSELFDVATNCNIELHAAPPITAQTSLLEFVVGQGLVEKMRMPAGHAALAVLFPWQVGQLWLSHETVTSHPSDHDKKTGKYKVFIEPVKVTREQVRIKSATLKKILQIWKSAQTDKELRDRYPEWMFPQEGTQTLAKDVIQPKNTAKSTMKTITLAAGTTHVPFNEVAHLIAYAIHPDIDDEDDNPSSYHFALIGLETELKRAAKFGQLPVKNKLTLGAHELPIGNALNHVLVTVDDLQAFVADRGIKVAVEATEPQATELKAKPQISRAPAPITPLTWSNHIQAIATVTPSPKWNKWRHMRDIEIWEAVALSLNLEPDKLPVYLGAYDKLGDDPFRICPRPFLERLQVVNSNCGITFSYKPVHDLKARCLVDLPEFVAWAVKRNIIDMPLEFVAIAATEPQAAPATSIVTHARLDNESHVDSWKDKARVRAAEIIERQRARDLYPNRIDIAEDIAKEFRKEGIFGVSGKPLTGETIKRHALKGISSANVKQLSTSNTSGKRGKN